MAAERTLPPRIWSKRIERGAKVVPYWRSLELLIHIFTWCRRGVIIASLFPHTLSEKVTTWTTTERARKIKPHKSSTGVFPHPSLQPARKRPLYRKRSLQQHKLSAR